MIPAVNIYVDADACPVKAEAAEVAQRHGSVVVCVANACMTIPRGPKLRMQFVSGAFDAADDWIAEQVRRERGESP